MDDTHDYINANHLGSVVDQGYDRSGEGLGGQRSRKHPPKFAARLFFAALFLLPFIFVPVAGWSVSVGRVVIVALLVGVAGAAVLGTRHAKGLLIPKIHSALLLAILAVLILSTVFSEAISTSLFGTSLEVGTFFSTVVALALALLAPIVLSSRKSLVYALMALLAGGVVLALFHIIRFIFGFETLSFGYFPIASSTPAGSWNDLGLFFGVTYLLSLTGMVFGRLRGPVLAVLGGVLVVSLLFVTLVNAQFLSFMLALATLILVAILFSTQYDPMWPPAVGSLLLLITVVLFAVPLSNINGDLFGASYTEVRPGWTSTQHMLGAGLGDVKNATLGMGPNTFTYLWQAERTDEIIRSNLWSIDFAYATGLIPTFAVTLGLLITLLMLGYAGYLGFQVSQAMQREDGDPLLVSVALSSGVAALFLWVFAIFDVFSITLFLLMFALSGIAMAAFAQLDRVATVSVRSTTRLGVLAKATASSLCVGVVLIALVLGTSRTIYGQGVIQANSAESIDGIVAAQKKVRLASQLERNDDFARTEAKLGLLRIQEFLAREDTDERDMPALKEAARITQQAVNRAREMNPRGYLNWVRSGLVFETLGILEMNDAFDVAEQSYARARELNPTNPEIILMQTRLAQLRGNSEEAAKFAKEAVELKPNYADAYLLQSDIALANDDFEAAKRYMRTGIEEMPNSSILSYQLGLIHYAQHEYAPAIVAFTNAISSDPDYANARYFRALARVYGGGDRDAALADLEIVREENEDNEVLLDVIANVEAGNEPLEGIADDANLPSADAEEEGAPENNTNVTEDLETESDPQTQTETEGVGEDDNTSL